MRAERFISAHGMRRHGAKIIHLGVVPGHLPAFLDAGKNADQHQRHDGGQGKARSQDQRDERVQP